jgi:hypothetical protein
MTIDAGPVAQGNSATIGANALMDARLVQITVARARMLGAHAPIIAGRVPTIAASGPMDRDRMVLVATKVRARTRLALPAQLAGPPTHAPIGAATVVEISVGLAPVCAVVDGMSRWWSSQRPPRPRPRHRRLSVRNRRRPPLTPRRRATSSDEATPSVGFDVLCRQQSSRALRGDFHPVGEEGWPRRCRALLRDHDHYASSLPARRVRWFG